MLSWPPCQGLGKGQSQIENLDGRGLPSYAVTLLPSFFRGWNGDNVSNYFVAGDNGEAISKASKSDDSVGVANTASQNFDENLELALGECPESSDAWLTWPSSGSFSSRSSMVRGLLASVNTAALYVLGKSKGMMDSVGDVTDCP